MLWRCARATTTKATTTTLQNKKSTRAKKRGWTGDDSDSDVNDGGEAGEGGGCRFDVDVY